MTRLGFAPVTFLYSPWVTSIWAIQYPFVRRTRCRPWSLGSRDPISKSPGGTHAIGVRVVFTAKRFPALGRVA